ncbi:HK97-gp10 family putative phage morphogenesis protein [Arthrobacter sp. VKM Ac-2550]|uniref:HK97-gp10 family putative phage morphogenesis protein n=1 Tax=Crystallibacter permensis TaxID=1938888 RepID=UPI002226A4A7|nr:HK97-gp10 family putative phage morphogenesis protein [Arthrobacter sp. VKM Ac-2550]MCW2132888.1 phage protein, HK97 gp10 family [Arthrobacter sp. VKM Ac-2550]
MDFDTGELVKLAGDIKKAAKSTGPRAQLVIRKTARDITADAKNLAPVDTGNLKGSISHTDLRTVGRSGTLTVEIGPTASYAVFVELGTSKMAAQPFMGPAADRRAPAFEQAMAQLGEEGLNG